MTYVSTNVAVSASSVTFASNEYLLAEYGIVFLTNNKTYLVYFEVNLSTSGYIQTQGEYGDVTKPAVINNLAAATGSNSGEATLSWTAPGDDGGTGNNGPGATYTVKYATYSDGGNRESWFTGGKGVINTYTQSWSVGNQGSSESKTLTLSANTTYYFGIKTTDDAENPSDIDSVATQASTASAAAPPGVADPTFTGVFCDSVTFAWTDGGNTLNTRYNVRASSTSGDFTGALYYPQGGSGAWITAASTTAVSLSEGTTYYFQSRARNWGNTVTSYTDLGSTVTFTCGPPGDIIGITISYEPSPYNFQNVSFGGVTQSTRSVTITNSGNVAETFSLYAATNTAVGSVWTLAHDTNSAAGYNRALLQGTFYGQSAMPNSSAFDSGTYTTVISTTSRTSSDTVYTIDAGYKGYNVPAGNSRYLWFKLKPPTTTSDENPPAQAIQVTITAEKS